MKNEVKYIKRLVDSRLEEWAKEFKHKPLLLRGARQVGKSSAVRNLAKKFEYFLEINFEKNAEAKQIFEGGNLSPLYLCEKLAAIFDVPIEAGKTLLFLDEIQSCLPAISSLRFFYEDFPELHVIAAGSLLEFALEEIPSFGVGRIRSLFMYPFSFDEFLQANGNPKKHGVRESPGASPSCRPPSSCRENPLPVARRCEPGTLWSVPLRGTCRYSCVPSASG
jgi:predicted AAA+ superfamily ATPase